MSREVSNASTSARPASPAPAATRQAPSAQGFGADRFEAAMNQAAARRHAMDAADRRGGPARRQEEPEPIRERDDASSRDDHLSQDRDDGGAEITALSALAQQQGSGSLAQFHGAAGLTGDIEAMAAMMEKAWLAAQADASKGMQVQFTDRTLMLAGFGVQRTADGGLAMQLAARNATPELEKAMELMRRRLEARGVALGEVSVHAADPDSSHRPVQSAGRDQAD